MSIINDQIALRQKNIDFIKQEINTLFKDAYNKLLTEYSLKIKQNVFDKDNTNEVREYLKREFEILKNEKCHFTNSSLSYIKNINIENNNFVYCLETIINSSLQVISEIYPTLEENNKDGISRNYSFFIRSVKNTCRKVFIKHLLESSIRIKTPETDIFKPNLDVFKDTVSHKFFNYLYSDWLADIPKSKCRPRLTLILSKLLKSSNCRIHSFEIVSKIRFAEYWNSLNHEYKIKIDNKSKVDLASVTSTLYETKFDGLKEHFEEHLMHLD